MEYVTTNISQKALAEKYGVSAKSLGYRAAVDHWKERRKAHRDLVIAKASEKASDAAAERMNLLMGGTDKMLYAALDAMDDPKQFYRYLVKTKEDGEPVTREEIFDKADVKAMKDMTVLLEKLTGLTRDLYGLPNREQELRQQLAEERLALEKRKLQQELDGQRRIEVVFQDSGPEEWNA